MKPLFVTFLLLMSGYLLAQPTLSATDAQRIIDHALQQQPQFWLPFEIPIRVERADRGTEAQFLEALFDHGLLHREGEMRMRTLLVNGRERRQVVAEWAYNYPESLERPSGMGFYYGRARLKHLVDLSTPYLVGQYHYIEAYIQWYVDDQQAWINDPLFEAARTLRRTRESFAKPFERRVFLMHDGASWSYWQGRPGELRQPMLDQPTFRR